MDVKKKLVELLDVGATIANNICGGTACDDCNGHNNGCTLYHIAEHLIANSVTVQEWISVNDRLPEGSTYVLARLSGGAIYEALCLTKGSKQWCAINREPFVNKDTVTHWMPLPPPPKTKGDEWK